MRALLIDIEMIEEGEEFFVRDEMFEHLVKSVRIREGESIKILNGKGLVGTGTVLSIEKKEVKLVASSVQYIEKNISVDLAIGITKKEAFESIIRESVELGINKIIPLRSEYSNGYNLKEDREKRILLSGILQSNNPWMPEILRPMEMDVFREMALDYDLVVCFSSITPQKLEKEFKKNADRMLIIVGPEGGFSANEEEMFESLGNSIRVNFPTHILRAPTAVAAAIGFTIGKGLLT